MLEFTGERYVPDAANMAKPAVNRLRQEHIVRYMLAQAIVAGRDVLDFGSGEGYGVAMMARSGARLAHGLELSAAAVEHASSAYGADGVEYFMGDVRSTRLDRSYDVITCFELIEHVDDQAAVIRNAKAHLRRGGFLVISTPRPSDLYQNEFHVKEITGAELVQLVNAEFAHLRRCAQSNFTVSLAGEGRLSLAGPVELVEITGNFTFEDADFAIVVASDDAAALAALKLGAVATLNDESYLNNVVRDNGILFRAERHLQDDVAVLRTVETNLNRDVEALHRSIAVHTSAIARLRTELDELLLAGEKASLLRPWWRFLYRSKDESLSRFTAANVARLLRAAAGSGDRLSHLTFLNGCPEGESKRYRIENIADAAKLCGVATTVLELAGCLERFRGTTTDLLIIFRARFTPEIGQLIDDARRRSIPIVFDIDDLVFEPESVDFIGAVRGISEEEKLFHHREVAAFRQTLERCDFATATTVFLAGRIEALGIPSRVVPNTINRKQLAVAELEPSPAARCARGIVRIGYFSGSPTHNKDFLEAAGALTRVLRECPNVVLHVVGSVELDERFREFEDRIRRSPFMPYLEMLRFMRRMHLVIAPLELENPFTAGKSELKLFEAALVGVPCVASAVESYRAAIENGSDGFVCATEPEWYDALLTLVRDEGRRLAMGENAYRRFVPRFYVGSRIADILETYRDCLGQYRQRVPESGGGRSLAPRFA